MDSLWSKHEVQDEDLRELRFSVEGPNGDKNKNHWTGEWWTLDSRTKLWVGRTCDSESSTGRAKSDFAHVSRTNSENSSSHGAIKNSMTGSPQIKSGGREQMLAHRNGKNGLRDKLLVYHIHARTLA